MIDLTIPGIGNVQIKHLVLDVNGTLTLDGILLDGVKERLESLARLVEVHLITADTLGRQDEIDRQLGVKAVRLKPGNEAVQKAEFIRSLGAEHCAAIGQGANDAGMLSAAMLGIAVLSAEGLAVETLHSARVLMPDIIAALSFLQNPKRIMATLRK